MSTRVEHTFTARINSKGMQGNSAKIEFDWKLPGSKFPFVLYEKDPERVESWGVGDSPEVTIAQGSLKEGKNGQYASDYFWDLVSIEHPITSPNVHQDGNQANRGSAATTARSEGIPANKSDPRQASIERQVAFKAAVDLALNYPAQALAEPEDPDIGNFIERWTERFCAILSAQPKPELPEHVCFVHAVPYRLFWNKALEDVYLHPIEDGKWCQEGKAQNKVAE